jgi:hypothetical protein|nr:MAG TPA: ParB protein [Caudoviricetes sp.]
MKLEVVKINDLKPLEKNVRKHNDKQIDELIKSVEQFGQTRAMVIDEDNNILIGNGLYFALVKMNKADVQCYRKTGLSEVEKKKLILSDNKIYSLGADNYDEINNYIQEITGMGDFEIAGYDKFILEQMTATDEQVEEAISNYGVITDVKYTQEDSKQETSYKEQEIKKEPEIKNEQVTMVTETKVGTEKNEKKYIICPSCGEMIYLD